MEWHRTDGGIIDAELLRPRSWVNARQLQRGSIFEVVSDELQVNGVAEIMEITDCPRLTVGGGEVVTGRFVTRRVDETVKMTFATGDILQGTASHPIWSPERQDWVPMGDWAVGDLVQGRDGLIIVTSVVFHQCSVPVYNLEIRGEHVYEVTSAEILVHNSAPCAVSFGKVDGPKSDPIHHIATNKNWISDLNGGPWSPRFEPIFKKAGMTLEDAANKVRIPGHVGPHPEEYHSEIFRRLQSVTDGLSGADYKAALLRELEVVAREASTVGSHLNNLLTRS